jgi:hypothetical protein
MLISLSKYCFYQKELVEKDVDECSLKTKLSTEKKQLDLSTGLCGLITFYQFC